ncbi:MAG: DUF1800 family protein [Acidobacteriota bacterium]
MQSLHGFLCAVLSVSMVVASTPGWSEVATPAGDTTQRPAYRGQLQGDERILQALNRFTFGPRPGDLDAVRAMGLDAWFEQQLHPATIQDPALEEKLAQFPAMQWSSQDLDFRLPSNAVIRQVIAGKIAMPETGLLRRVYLDEVARVEERQRGKAGPKRRAAANSNTMGPQTGMAPAEMSSFAQAKAAADPLLVAGILSLPPRDRVMKLAAMPQPELDAFFHALKGPQRQALFAGLSPDYREDIGALENPERVVVEELMAERLTRDIYAQAQLQEVMTDFWLNHFNVYLRKNETMPYYLVSYARDTIRPRALGNFEDLLEAVAHSPAMLLYLDNAQSVGPDSRAAERAKRAAMRNRKRKVPEGLNENYGRELMELHTLGVNGGYTQADVIQAARILTGWSVDQPQRGGGFQFNENRHEPGSNKVMGKKFKDHGEREGEDFLHFLAARPATARFLSRELAERFVSDDPPQTLVDRMAKSYLKSKGNIADVLRTMYRSPEFWSQDAYRAKVKTPVEYVVSAARASDAEITNMQPLVYALRMMGMPLYGCIPPTGYKWDAAEWVSTGQLVDRMNFALALATNRLNGVKTEWAGAGPASEDVLAEEARLESALLGEPASATTRQAVLAQFAKPAGAQMVAMQNRRGPGTLPRDKQDQWLAGLLLGSPEFQRR